MSRAPFLDEEEFAATLADAHAGVSAAFARLFHAYAAAVEGYARMHGVRDGDDITNETFLGAVKTLDSFSGDEAAFRSWLFTIAHRRIVDVRRKESRRLKTVDVDPYRLERPAPDDTEETALAATTTEDVRRLCESLAPDQRDVLLLRLVAGLTIEEIASTLDKTVGATKQLQRRGLEALRRRISEKGVPL